MTQILCRPIELITRNVSQRLDVVIRDQAGQDADPSFLQVTVQDANEVVRHRDGYPTYPLTGRVAIDAASTTLTGTNTLFTSEVRVGDVLTVGVESAAITAIASNTSLTLGTPRAVSTSNAVANKSSRIQRTGVGRYYIEWGDAAATSNIITQSETNLSGALAVHWRASAPGEETVSAVQLARIISVRTQMWIPYIRTIVDKAKKNVNDDPENPCFLGYTDAMLVQFLEDGLSWINAFQPYPMWANIDDFPDIHRRVLFDAALMAAITSQELFAVDTDLNYSDQGNAFVIEHQPKLSSIANATWQRLTQTVPLMKRHYVRSGAIRVEAGPSFRFSSLLYAAPPGSVFRNWFSS